MRQSFCDSVTRQACECGGTLRHERPPFLRFDGASASAADCERKSIKKPSNPHSPPCLYLHHVNSTGDVFDERLGLLLRHRLQETSTLKKGKDTDVNRKERRRVFGLEVKRLPYVDDDKSGICDHILLQLVEGGVGVIVKAPELLFHVVQLDEGLERLAAGAAVHRWGEELQGGVVLMLHPLDKLTNETQGG